MLVSDKTLLKYSDVMEIYLFDYGFDGWSEWMQTN